MKVRTIEIEFAEEIEVEPSDWTDGAEDYCRSVGHPMKVASFGSKQVETSLGAGISFKTNCLHIRLVKR